MLMSQASKRRWALSVVLGGLVHFASIPAVLLCAQEVVQAPQAVPVTTNGGFVPFHILLQQADARRPLTAEGWIVHEKTSSPWTLDLDPAKRAYEHFEYPLRLRQYDSQIRIARAEVDSWRRRLSVYRYFNKAGALFITNENAILSLIQAEEQLRNLRYERSLFVRQHQRERQFPLAEVVIDEKVVDPGY